MVDAGSLWLLKNGYPSITMAHSGWPLEGLVSKVVSCYVIMILPFLESLFTKVQTTGHGRGVEARFDLSSLFQVSA